MCRRADVEFTEWECARILTEFKRNFDDQQWALLRRHQSNFETPTDALRFLIVIGFENRRLKRLGRRYRQQANIERLLVAWNIDVPDGG